MMTHSESVYEAQHGNIFHCSYEISEDVLNESINKKTKELTENEIFIKEDNEYFII